MADGVVDLSIEKKGDLVLENRKNSNLLVDLLDLLGTYVVDDVSRSISSLENVFAVFLSRKCLQSFGEGRSSADDLRGLDDGNETFTPQLDAEKVFSEWLQNKYSLFIKRLLQLITHEAKMVQKKSLRCLMRMVQTENESMIKNQVDSKKPQFTNALFSKITNAVLLSDFSKLTLLNVFQEYLIYDDIQFYTLKNLGTLINNKFKRLGNKDKVTSNTCNLLLKITAQRESGEESGMNTFIKNEFDAADIFSWQSKEKKKLFSNVWLSLLQLNIPHESLKKVLANLHEGVMPYMDDPRMLIDFLTDVYDMEGPVALLALNGLFILIHQYNLDYPEFFTKLYHLINSKVFELKYRSRFFILTDLFLTSTNLPAYLAAAFIKRFSRICLHTSPDGIKIALVLIENLLKRHPSCRVLIHRKLKTDNAVGSEYDADPYDHDEKDPAKCNAFKSSLWELKTLEQHYHPDIQEAVKVFQKPFSKEEIDVSDCMNEDYSNLFNDELVAFEEEETIPFAFKPATQLFDNLSTGDFWCIE